MTLSSAGLIGGAIGLAMATGVYLAVTSALKGRAADPGRTAEEREKSASMIRMILLADIPILTGIGYYFGQTVQ
ncbi:MAG: hypothetical protein U1E61_05290 [Bradyrhizobium sp.]